MIISKESINYSIRNLKKNKGRSFLTVFSIFLGIATIFVFISFGLGLYDYIDSFTTSGTADKLMIQGKGLAAPGLDTSFRLTDEDITAIERVRGVIDVSGIYARPVEVVQRGTRRYVYGMAYDPEKPLIIEFFGDIGIEKGRILQKGDSGKVVLGYNYMLDNKILPRALDINERLEINGVKMSVVGFFESVGSAPDDAQVYFTKDYFESLYPEEEISYAMIVVRADRNDIEGTAERIKRALRNKRNQEEGKEDFTVQSFQELLDSFSVALNIVIGFIIMIAFISILVSAVNTANTMITSVLERYQEIGVLKSIGAKNSEIFKIFLFESGLLGLIAGVVGVLVGFGLAYLGGVILVDLGWGFLQPSFSPWLFIGCILFATFTGAISGVIPAWRASKINAVDALRYE